MKKAQNLLEYALIFILVTIVSIAIVTRFNLKSIRSYVFVRPVDSANPSNIKIEPMTDKDS